MPSTTKRLTFQVSKKKWRIHNRFIGFAILSGLALFCLFAPKSTEKLLNDEID